jgi:hypothetical protein
VIDRREFLELLVVAAGTLSCSTPQPARFEKVVRSHVTQILEKGYAESLAWDDLSYGRIFVRRGKEGCYANMNELLENVELIAYYSAEFKNRWDDFRTPLEKKIPRSIVGFMDGRIMPAIDFVGRENLKNEWRYNRFGIVDIDDIVRKAPHLYNGNAVADNTCVMVDGKQRPTSFQFHIDEHMKITFGREYKNRFSPP